MVTRIEDTTLQGLTGCKILVVDDDRINLRILRGILQNEHYVIEEAGTAEEALEKYTAFQPDLVLFDVLLPGMSGFEACRELKRRHGGQAAPVMFITAKQESESIVEGFAAGGVDYVLKPFRKNEVVARMRTHLNVRMLLEKQRLLVDQLSRANAAKNKFLGMAAHDLRNPLASIRGMTEFMLDGTVGELNPDQLELLNLMHQASQGMVTLVNDLLDVAIIKSGELKLHTAPVGLAELGEKSVALNALESSRKKTRIVMDTCATAPVLTLDAAKIRQVIDNLLSNAVKYSPPGSLVRVTLETRPDGTHIVSVRDQGPGIPENERDKLFKDFGRLSARPTGGEKSTGLGLAICRKIMEAHHGTIDAENLPAGGCEFRVTLPSQTS
jgi:two-component system, sensor histidine kinase and response regulator